MRKRRRRCRSAPQHRGPLSLFHRSFRPTPAFLLPEPLERGARFATNAVVGEGHAAADARSGSPCVEDGSVGAEQQWDGRVWQRCSLLLIDIGTPPMLASALVRVGPAGASVCSTLSQVDGRQFLNALDGLLQGRDEVDLDRVPRSAWRSANAVDFRLVRLGGGCWLATASCRVDWCLCANAEARPGRCETACGKSPRGNAGNHGGIC